MNPADPTRGAARRLLVIGVGNPHRGDDAAGLEVARRLQERLAGIGVGGDSETGAGAGAVTTAATVDIATGEGVDLMSRWEGADRVILVDAARSGAPAGTIHRFDARRETVPSSFFRYSTHVFSVAEAIELARVLGTLPHELAVIGIEGAVFDAGGEISEAVESAVRSVVAELAETLDARD